MERANGYLDALEDAKRFGKRGHLDMETENQLEFALYPLKGISALLTIRDDGTQQIRLLFVEACDGIPQILSHIEVQGLTSGTVGMISELMLQKFKPEIILEQINASKPSITPSIITMEMVEPVVALLFSVEALLREKHAERDHTIHDVLESRVEFASYFLWFTENHCIEHEKMKDIFALSVDVAYAAADLAFLNLHSKLEEDQASEFLAKMSLFRPELR